MWVLGGYQTNAQFCVAKSATPPRENVHVLRFCDTICIFIHCDEIILVILFFNLNFADFDANLRR